MLTELDPLADAALPVAEFRDHLKLGTGFADADAQDGALGAYLRAALAAIEGRIGKALIARRFRWRIAAWRAPDAQPLPLAPVSEILALETVDRDGTAVAVPAERFALVPDFQRPKIAATGAALPAIPTEGTAQIEFRAGFGAAWTDVPVDLRQAVLMLAARYYEGRHEGALQAGGTALPFGVLALIERWRTVRVLGGGRT